METKKSINFGDVINICDLTNQVEKNKSLLKRGYTGLADKYYKTTIVVTENQIESLKKMRDSITL